jgi:iron complex outermembrane receptor protein
VSAKNLRLRLSVGAILAAASLGEIAVAQEKESVLEEIVVTAERREQSLQEVPLSITAFGDEQREVVGILSIQDMANFAPGMSYNTSVDRPSIRGVGRQSNTFSIDSPVANYFDGVYTTSVQDAQRRPIFIERTEILRGPQGALSGRGSIGGAINTISKRPKDEFGAEVRAFGGNYERYGLEGTVTGSLTDWFRFRVNLGDYNQDKGYFENIATGKSEGDQPNNRTIQDYMVEIDIGESIDLFLKAAFANYDESRRTGYTTAPYNWGSLEPIPASGGGSGTSYRGVGSSNVPVAAWGYFRSSSIRVGTNTQNPVLETGDARNFANDFPSRQWLDDHHNYVAHLTWHAPIVDVKWIGGHNNYKYTQLTDADGTDVVQMTLPSTNRVVNPGGYNIYQEEREWYSNELTFTSTTEGSFSWIIGLYQSNEDYVQTPFASIYPGYPELNTPGFYTGSPVFAPNPFPFAATRGVLDGETVSSAAFGQIDYELNDAWKFTLGMRYNRDRKEVSEMTRLIGNAYSDLVLFGLATDITGAPNVLPAVDQTVPGVYWDRGINPATGYRERDLKGEWTATTGSVGVDYTPTEDDLIYFRFAKGYRPGGFNAGFINNPPMFEHETVDSFELGYKTTMFGRVQLSSSVFYYDYQDIQLPLPVLSRCTTPGDPSSCTIVNSFVNLPSGESKGLEFEANWAVTDNLSAMLNYGYLDATIKEALAPGSLGYTNSVDPAAILRNAKPIANIPGGFDTNYTYLPTRTQDISGNKLNDVPEHKIAANVNYTFNFDAGGNLVLSASAVWRDSSYSDVFETEESKNPSYTTVGARIIWTNESDNFTVMLYGTNLTDEKAVDGSNTTRVRTGAATSIGTATPNGAAYFQGYNLAPPREFGLELQYRLGGAR